VSVTGAVGSGTALGTITLTQTGGTTFTSTVDAATVTLTNTTGTITFNGALTAATLNTANAGYNVAINAGGTITNAVTFSNSGTVTLGNGSSDSITFTAGVTATAPSQVNIAGTVQSTNSTISIGDSGTPIVLTAGSTISAGSGAITLGGTVDGAFALTLDSSDATTFSGIIGGSTPLASLTTNAGGTLVINTTAISTTGAQTFGENVTLGAMLL
jgi:fibronectin-binding autotransporter adhesin